ncbi:MAG: DUF4129 domain-containing protein [Desulfosarcina sp.]|nr:DUF4129 domain-containing protein [Desulfobacterales bacterium]
MSRHFANDLVLVVALRNRYQRNSDDTRAEPPAPTLSVPDLHDDHVRADELPVDEWLRLAERLAAEGQYRLAMRACFFSTLNMLSERHVLMIADYKSNREYEAEVGRRASDRQSLGAVFRSSVARLDRAWYGMRAVTRRDFNQFADQQREMANLAEG